MLIARSSPGHAAPFHVREFNVLCSNRSFAAAGDAEVAALPPGASVGYKRGSQAVNTAIVKLELPSGETVMQAAEGNGPVNALALALRGGLAPHHPQLQAVRLRDYRVDLLGREGTSAAVTRVTIDFAGADGATWRTVGAHSSIIEASFRALVDGLEWAIAHCDAESCALPAAAPPPAPLLPPL
jgi:2-isopropylmalate synthase